LKNERLFKQTHKPADCTMTTPILLDIAATIETERLLLRVPRAGDGEALYEAIAESLPELRLFLASLPWVAAEQSAASSEIYCRTAASNFMARNSMAYLLWERATHKVVGACGLHRPDWTVPKIEIGYWCRTSSGGTGLISEAVTALSQLAFQKLEVARLELITDEANGRSRRVAERCGFALEGILRNERRAPDGTLRNTCVYAKFPIAPLQA
jgi:RimJ/RimL family protein N-acetyltransferase